MKPTTEGGVPPAQPGNDKSRRQALKRFGRYAAAAPAAMVLLQPRQGRAHHGDWHTPPGPFTNPGGGGEYGD